MTLTSHGHHIPGTTHDDEQMHPMVHRCGGPDMCKTCKDESTKHWHPSNGSSLSEVEVRRPNVRKSLNEVISDIRQSRVEISNIDHDKLESRLKAIADIPDACPTCSGPVRQTVGMVCPDCGTDYS